MIGIFEVDLGIGVCGARAGGASLDFKGVGALLVPASIGVIGGATNFFGGARCGVAGAGGFLNDGPGIGGLKGFIGVAGRGRRAESGGTDNGW